MGVTIRGQVGIQTLQDGTEQAIRLGRNAEQVVTDLHGRYYEQTYRRNLYTAYAQSVATSVAGTAMIGLQVWNGSIVGGTNGVNLVVLKVGGMIKVTSATTTGLALAVGTGQVSAPTSQTAITKVSNNFVGGAAPNALATNAGTFALAPSPIFNLMHNTAAIATTGEDPGFNIDLEGSIIIPPQCYVCIAAVGAAVAASGSDLHLMWEEVPV